MKIRESCSCGSESEYEGREAVLIQQVLWRAEHKVCRESLKVEVHGADDLEHEAITDEAKEDQLEPQDVSDRLIGTSVQQGDTTLQWNGVEWVGVRREVTICGVFDPELEVYCLAAVGHRTGHLSVYKGDAVMWPR